MVRRYQHMVAWFKAELDTSRCTVRRRCADRCSASSKKLVFVCIEANLHGGAVRGGVHDDAKLRLPLLGDSNGGVDIKTGLPDLLHDRLEHCQRLAEREILELMERAQKNLHLDVARHVESFGHGAEQTHEAFEKESSPQRFASIAFQPLAQIHHLLAEIRAC